MPTSRLYKTLTRTDGKLYRQVASRLGAAITSGQIPLGTELPSEAELAQGFGVSIITLRHALRELEGEGLIQKRAAKPAMVISTERRIPLARTMNSLEDIAAATAGATLDISSWTPRRAAQAARVFSLSPDTACPCLSARVMLEGAPLSDVTIFFPPAIGNRLAREDFRDVVVFRSVQRELGLHLSGARVTVRAELADAALARRLDCAAGAAVLVSEIVYLDASGRPVEFTIARHRGDRYSLAYAFAAT